MENPNETPIGIDEASEFLMISKSHLYKLTSTGEIPHYKPSKRVIFLKSDLIEFIKNSRVKGPEEVRSAAAKHTMGMK